MYALQTGLASALQGAHCPSCRAKLLATSASVLSFRSPPRAAWQAPGAQQPAHFGFLLFLSVSALPLGISTLVT